LIFAITKLLIDYNYTIIISNKKVAQPKEKIRREFLTKEKKAVFVWIMKPKNAGYFGHLRLQIVLRKIQFNVFLTKSIITD
jgi:hypothetical protein